MDQSSKRLVKGLPSRLSSPPNGMFSDPASHFCKPSQGVAISYSHELPPRLFVQPSVGSVLPSQYRRIRNADKSIFNLLIAHSTAGRRQSAQHSLAIGKSYSDQVLHHRALLTHWHTVARLELPKTNAENISNELLPLF